MVSFMAESYSRERMRSRISQGKVQGAKVQGTG